MSYLFINLQYILDKKNISARELAKRTGIRHPTISEMCNNSSKHLPLKNIALICDELEIDVSDLLILKK
ncbi:helix-turn-helix domain-containing protein [Paenibacillus sp. HJL G12]|uniref:Helix-turn-helix domain-containing protein n=1 Tax=Paenibacillus dendrobii TaxID=2691084 RepID=A0A7X3LIS9_9BACL|nr:helix-turn-helix transcriptional regulator [Paenibacillus dendrobii]MWV44903.1 helix-turn-helix domain-containing protein [Paenibacillus dendrobii]